MAYGHNNYGTSLQGYALLKIIQQLGYEIEVIHYEKQLTVMEKIAWVINALRVGEMKELKKRISINKEKKIYPQYAEGLKKRTDAVDAYKKKKLAPFFRKYIGYHALHEGSKNYDTVVVGSDQVWTPLSLPNRFFNLLFVEDSVRKIAYASSFGVSEIPRFQRKATGQFLNRFNKIGVREVRGKEIVEELSSQKAQVVADPTLLLTRDDWESEIKEIISESTKKNMACSAEKPYIFCYFISSNEDARKQAKILSEETDLPIITIRHMEQYRDIDETIGDEVPYAVDPNDFVRYISHATYVCTDSFHCTVFSIIFHRQFMTFYRTNNTDKRNRNSRIDSLFYVLGVNREHLYGGDIKKITTPVEWECVDTNLKTLRTQSLSFLIDALNS